MSAEARPRWRRARASGSEPTSRSRSTGIAGPDGGTPEKPVGLVYLHAEGPDGGLGRDFSFPGDRASIRARSVVGALHLVRKASDTELLTEFWMTSPDSVGR